MPVESVAPVNVIKLRRELSRQPCERCGLSLDRGASFVLSFTEGRFIVLHEDCADLVHHAPRLPWRHTVQTYIILPGGDGITCLRCGRTSYNPNDVREHYCLNCHVFHDDGR